MCYLVSWIEASTEGEPVLLYLTAKDLRSSKGRKLKGRIGEDVNGHGAIREYYDLKPGFGVDRECTDFSTPGNFPDEIVEHIKAGSFRGFGNPEGLLGDTAHAEYDKVSNLAYAKYDKARVLSWAKYLKVCDPAYAEYEKVRGLAYAKYDKVRALAYAEYLKVRALAYAEFKKVRDTKFWDLFADQSNRMEQWKDGE